jgi:DnaJ-class molecular chaperone
MSDQNLGTSTQQPTGASTNPGDEAPPGTVGTGEAICPDCAGTGRKGSERCPNCNGTGKVIRAVGGA